MISNYDQRQHIHIQTLHEAKGVIRCSQIRSQPRTQPSAILAPRHTIVERTQTPTQLVRPVHPPVIQVNTGCAAALKRVVADVMLTTTSHKHTHIHITKNVVDNSVSRLLVVEVDRLRGEMRLAVRL